MKAVLNALSFFLVCLGAYYIGLVLQAPREEQSLVEHSENSHNSQETHIPEPEEELPKKKFRTTFQNHQAKCSRRSKKRKSNSQTPWPEVFF
ncbi:hypothetical protein MATL_G00147690 [Megalops atlanticus]|uniref:Uncharacterized protein n=1 Tax=Megalops atlanticus TaxID=7932 RepID=A0A9D3PW03_MEGAT|nr:hypothetical protein MATL_G00147690 [Megalops atlanticus]